MPTPLADTTYVLPIRRTAPSSDDDLPAYLTSLTRLVPVIVVDGSPPRLRAPCCELAANDRGISRSTRTAAPI